MVRYTGTCRFPFSTTALYHVLPYVHTTVFRHAKFSCAAASFLASAAVTVTGVPPTTLELRTETTDDWQPHRMTRSSGALTTTSVTCAALNCLEAVVLNHCNLAVDLPSLIPTPTCEHFWVPAVYKFIFRPRRHPWLPSPSPTQPGARLDHHQPDYSCCRRIPHLNAQLLAPVSTQSRA